MIRLSRPILLGTITLLLSACGSSNKETTPETTIPEDTTPTWTQGVFEDASIFKNKCENPRTGVDLNGDAYPDQAGSTLHEMHWLRSGSNDTYLWYDEIIDQDIAIFSDKIEYFGTLKTNATTASGAKKDQYHFTQDTAEYQQLASGSTNASYGLNVKYIQAYPPRLARVTYVEPNSPAANANLQRGAKIISIDGVSVETSNDIDTLINGLNPETNGEVHTFVVQDVGQTETRTVSLTSQVVTKYPVQNETILTNGIDKIGYLTFNTFSVTTAEAALASVFSAFSEENINDLIIDLRYNSGGYLAISAQLGYMIAGDTLTEGKTFEKTVFNDKHPTINPITSQALSDLPFIKTGVGFSVDKGQSLPSVNLNRVFILSSNRTCSASESLINGLRGIDVDVVMIGNTTCGKPYGFYSTDNCGTTYSTIQFRGENEKGFGDYSDGFSPNNSNSTYGELVAGCQVEDDLLTPLGDVNEAMLKAALAYRDNGSCPEVPASRALKTEQRTDITGDLNNDPRMIERSLKEQIYLDSLRFKR